MSGPLDSLSLPTIHFPWLAIASHVAAAHDNIIHAFLPLMPSDCRRTTVTVKRSGWLCFCHAVPTPLIRSDGATVSSFPSVSLAAFVPTSPPSPPACTSLTTLPYPLSAFHAPFSLESRLCSDSQPFWPLASLEMLYCVSSSVLVGVFFLTAACAEGVTFLALGNGAPDIFSAIAAFSHPHTAGLAVGALFGECAKMS